MMNSMATAKIVTAVVGLVAIVSEAGGEIGGVPLVGLTAPALLGLFVWLVFNGYLVPRRTYQDMKDDRDYWRQAHSISEEARGVKDEQLNVVKDIGQTVMMFSRALDRVVLQKTMEAGEEDGVKK